MTGKEFGINVKSAAESLNHIPRQVLHNKDFGVAFRWVFEIPEGGEFGAGVDVAACGR